MRWSTILLPACIAALGLCGCTGYRLGPSNGQVARAKSIQVGLFVNLTLQPHLETALTSALRKSLQQDGTYRLDTGGDSDIVVNGEIKAYDRHELSYLPNDVLTVQDFRVTMTVHVTARERGSGKTVLDREVTGSTLVRAGSDLTSSERQALPLLAGDVARNITALLVDGVW